MKKLTPEQLEKLTPEVREKYEKRLKKVIRNRRILAAAVGVVIVAAVCIGLSMTVLFNISTIKVAKKGSFYSEQEIISASGLDTGKNMLRTDFDAAALRIEKMLPYVLDAKIKKTATGAVTITVTDNTAAMIFEAPNGYGVADVNGKVLEILSEKPENSNLILLKTAKNASAVPGEMIGFADKSESELYNRIVSALKDSGLNGKITGIDISSPVNIRIEYQHRMRIKLGDASDLETKLAGAAEAIKMEDADNPNTIAEVVAEKPKSVSVIPLDSLDDVPGVKKEKREEETTAADEENSDENEDADEEAGTDEKTDEDGNGDSGENKETEKNEENSENNDNEEAAEEEKDDGGDDE